MGVAKLRGDHAINGIVSFFKAGLEFCLTEKWNLAFVDCLIPYLRFLPASEVKDVAVFANNLLQDGQQVSVEVMEAERAHREEGDVPGRDVGKMINFLYRIGGQAAHVFVGAGSKRKSGGGGRKAAQSAGKGKSRAVKAAKNIVSDRSSSARATRAKVQLDSVVEQEEDLEEDDNDDDNDKAQGEEVSINQPLGQAIDQLDNDLKRSEFLRNTQTQSIMSYKTSSNIVKSKHVEAIEEKYAFGLDIQDDDDEEKVAGTANVSIASYHSEDLFRSATVSSGVDITYSKKRTYSSSSSNRNNMEWDAIGVKQMMIEDEDDDVLAELDNIPSRRRLR